MFASVVPVLVPVPLEGPFDYRLGAGEPPPPGTYVIVPFAGRELIGVVWDERSERSYPTHRLKAVEAVLDAPPMPTALRALVSQVARETLSPRGSVLKLALSVPAGLEPWPERLVYRRTQAPPGARMTRQRELVLAALPGATALPAPALAKAAARRAGRP